MNYFINISNHPSNTWSEKQLNVAKRYGKVIDIPFPNIPALYRPEDMRYDVAVLAEKIRSYINPDHVVTVHIMGEMTFTYMLVDYFRNTDKVVCVASTTQRMVEEKDGVKLSKFEFVQFREYLRY